MQRGLPAIAELLVWKASGSLHLLLQIHFFASIRQVAAVFRQSTRSRAYDNVLDDADYIT